MSACKWFGVCEDGLRRGETPACASDLAGAARVVDQLMKEAEQ